MFRLYSMIEGDRQLLGRLEVVWSTLFDTLTKALFISVPSAKCISRRL